MTLYIPEKRNHIDKQRALIINRFTWRVWNRNRTEPELKHDTVTRAKLTSRCAGPSFRLKSVDAGRFTGCRRSRPARSRRWRCGESRRKLIFIRGIPVEVVGHEEDVRSSGDQSVARFHHLKAQKAERTHQFHCGQKNHTSEQRTDTKTTTGANGLGSTYHDRPCSCKSRQTRWALSDVLQQTPAETRSWNTQTSRQDQTILMCKTRISRV